MSTLLVPIHLPIKQTKGMVERELRFRNVLSVKVGQTFMEIEHEPMKSYEVEQEVERLCLTSL
jgi:hypothetical protein